jgi:hypothetical protein
MLKKPLRSSDLGTKFAGAVEMIAGGPPITLGKSHLFMDSTTGSIAKGFRRWPRGFAVFSRASWI